MGGRKFGQPYSLCLRISFNPHWHHLGHKIHINSTLNVVFFKIFTFHNLENFSHLFFFLDRRLSFDAILKLIREYIAKKFQMDRELEVSYILRFHCVMRIGPLRVNYFSSHTRGSGAYTQTDSRRYTCERRLT